jgi:hypothetical protein
MFFKPYTKFNITVPHSIDFMKKRLKVRALSPKKLRNYFMTFDGRTDFSFTEYSKYVVLYPVCDTRNSLRGEFLLQFDSVSDSESLIHVTVKVSDIVVVFSIFWLCGVSAFLFFSLLSKFYIGSIIGFIMLGFFFALSYFMRKSAENELADMIHAFKNFISDDYINAGDFY